MYVLNITDDYDNSTNCTQTIDDENNIVNINLKILLLSILGAVVLLSLLGLIIYTTLKPLITNKWWRSFYTQPILLDVSLENLQNVGKAIL